MSSVGCLRNQWCFNKSLALGRLISFLFRHKLTNSASSFEKMFSGTLGACDHAAQSGMQRSTRVLQGRCRGAAGALQGCCRGTAVRKWCPCRCVHGPGYVCVARYLLVHDELALGLGLGLGIG